MLLVPKPNDAVAAYGTFAALPPPPPKRSAEACLAALPPELIDHIVLALAESRPPPGGLLQAAPDILALASTSRGLRAAVQDSRVVRSAARYAAPVQPKALGPRWRPYDLEAQMHPVEPPLFLGPGASRLMDALLYATLVWQSLAVVVVFSLCAQTSPGARNEPACSAPATLGLLLGLALGTGLVYVGWWTWQCRRTARRHLAAYPAAFADVANQGGLAQTVVKTRLRLAAEVALAQAQHDPQLIAAAQARIAPFVALP